VSLQLLCRKVGNTQIFTDTGECIPVTVLEAGSNTVVQKKTEDKDGYSAVQLGFGELKPGRTPKALAGHHAKSGAAPHRALRESRLTPEEVDAFVANIPFYGFAALCIDHPEVQAMIPRMSDRRIVTYGFSPQADVRGLNLETTPDEVRFDVRVIDRKNGVEKINELELNQDEKEWFDKGVNSVKSALAGIDI